MLVFVQSRSLLNKFYRKLVILSWEKVLGIKFAIIYREKKFQRDLPNFRGMCLLKRKRGPRLWRHLQVVKSEDFRDSLAVGEILFIFQMVIVRTQNPFHLFWEEQRFCSLLLEKRESHLPFSPVYKQRKINFSPCLNNNIDFKVFLCMTFDLAFIILPQQ